MMSILAEHADPSGLLVRADEDAFLASAESLRHDLALFAGRDLDPLTGDRNTELELGRRRVHAPLLEEGLRRSAELVAVDVVGAHDAAHVPPGGTQLQLDA